VIEEEQAISGKSLREIYEAKNYLGAIKYVDELAQENRGISEQYLCEFANPSVTGAAQF
jgi:Fic family protein